MARRPAPTRTCVACRQARPKRDLVRIVRTVAGPVEVDPSGKKSGRGAYLCSARSCWELGLRRGALARALKAELSESDRRALIEYTETLPRMVASMQEATTGTAPSDQGVTV